MCMHMCVYVCACICGCLCVCVQGGMNACIYMRPVCEDKYFILYSPWIGELLNCHKNEKEKSIIYPPLVKGP